MVKNELKKFSIPFFEIKGDGISELKFYLNSRGKVFWSESHERIKPIKSLPKRLQIPFMIKFIQDHELSERIKGIEEPIICIELYLKAKFMTNGFL